MQPLSHNLMLGGGNIGLKVFYDQKTVLVFSL